MPELRLGAQTTAYRIDSKTATTSTTGRDNFALNGDIENAATYNATAPDPHQATCLPDLAEPGETIRGKPVYGFTGDWDATREGDNNIVNQLWSSGLLLDASDGIITFGFFTGKHAVGLNNNPGFGEGFGYAPFTLEQQAAARIAIQNWDDIIAPEYEEVSSGPGVKGWAQNKADIWLANTSTGPAQAWAYYPGYGPPYGRVSSDVWTADPRYNSSNAQLDPGFYGLHTLNHELGHSIGLSHPGDYDFGDDSDGDGVPDPITYEGDAFYYQDNNQYTIMSYFDSYEAGNNQIDWNFMRFVYPSTPMVDDVWVAQYLYGVETETRTGDTIYGFNATSDVLNDAMRFEPGEMATMFTIWDAGGTDTLDLSGYSSDSVIDLREGGYSSAGGWNAYGDAPLPDPSDVDPDVYLDFVNAYNLAAGYPPRSGTDPDTDLPVVPAGQPADYYYQLYFVGGLIERDAEGNPILDENGEEILINEGIPWAETMGFDWLMENNIGIAYGAIIENAIGGEGDDRINGNQADNEFTGNGGADTFIIADYSGVVERPIGDQQYETVTIDDESVDTITDFDSDEGDLISLCTLGVEWSDLIFDTSVAGQTTVTVDRGEDDLTFIAIGSTLVQGDFIFG